VTKLKFMMRVMEIFYRADIREQLIWYIDAHDGDLFLAADVSDVFSWGAADAEDITVETLPELEQAYADLKRLHEKATTWTADLYAARRRGHRPQGAAYPKPDVPCFTELAMLFNACGPERPTGFGNPKRPPVTQS